MLYYFCNIATIYINHDILYQKLYCYGVRGQALDLIKSYLTNRSQVVKLKNIKSEPCKVLLGVPQGSILGRLLFLVYINDMLSLQIPGKIVSYADDTVVLCNGDNWISSKRNMTQSLKEVSDWLALNELTLNLSKTEFIAYGIYCISVPVDINININGSAITRVKSAKYLGVLFDCYMRWDYHVVKILKKTRYLLYIFKKLSKYMDSNSLMIIYYALFNSIANYGIVAWGSAYNNVIEPLQRLQYRILRLIKVNDNMKKPLNFTQMFKLESTIFYYQEIQSHYNKNFKTRKQTIFLDKINKTTAFKNNKTIANKCFNELPKELKNLKCNNKKVLKQKIKKFLYENPGI